MKLQTILYPTESICNEEALYLHKDGGFILFDGFFNLFYLEKHHKYCDLQGIHLELSIRRVKKIVLMHDREEIKTVSFDDVPVSGMDRLRGKANYLDQDTRVSLKLPYNEYEKGVFWFKAEPVDIDGDWEVCGHFEGKVGASAKRAVELAVNICTFKREAYITRNMKALTQWQTGKDVNGQTPEAADHIHVFVIDNGQSLAGNQEFMKVISNRITVIPNANTGGTGGFSRGMLEAIEMKDRLGLTHLLMMDDDAVFDPDIFVRLYGVLSTLRPEYEGITVAGALMREDHKYIQHAAGEWYSQFKVHNDHPLVDMRNFETCTSDWVTGPIGDSSAAASRQREGMHDLDYSFYGAWWCCCYNMDAVTKENIPLPLFVHHDDIQFGLKQANRGIVLFNGICVWHQGFELVFPGDKQYYNMRNTLITSIQFEREYLMKNVKKWTVKRYIGMLISYRYADCEFVYRGLMDFLKGRQWLEDSNPELIHKQLMADYNRLCPMLYYEQIKDYVKEISTDLLPDELRNYYSHERFEANLWKKMTFNGWFLPGDNELTVLTPLDSPWKTYRHKKVLLYEPGSGRGAVMTRSNKEFFKGICRILRMCIAIDVWKIKGGKW